MAFIPHGLGVSDVTEVLCIILVADNHGEGRTEGISTGVEVSTGNFMDGGHEITHVGNELGLVGLGFSGTHVE